MIIQFNIRQISPELVVHCLVGNLAEGIRILVVGILVVYILGWRMPHVAVPMWL